MWQSWWMKLKDACGKVHIWQCDANNANQKFTFDYNVRTCPTKCRAIGKVGMKIVHTNQKVAPGTTHQCWRDTERTCKCECNWTCECSPLCSNRSMQRGVTHRLQVFRHSLKGWCLRTLTFIKKDEVALQLAALPTLTWSLP